MNIFTATNSIVQNLAKFLAFGTGLVLSIIVWIIGRINASVMVAIGIAVWVFYKVALVFNKISHWIRWAPETAAVHCFLFALDISPAEHKEKIAELEAAIEQEKYLKSMAAKAAKRAVEALETSDEETLPLVTDFQLGQEDMREKVVAAIALWFERDRRLPAHAATAQTIQELVYAIPTELVAEEVKNDPS